VASLQERLLSQHDDDLLKIQQLEQQLHHVKDDEKQHLANAKTQKIAEEMRLMKLAKKASAKQRESESAKLDKLKKLQQVVNRQEKKIAFMQASETKTQGQLEQQRAQNKKSLQAAKLLSETAQRVKKFAMSTATRMGAGGKGKDVYTQRVKKSLESDVSHIDELLQREHDREAEVTKEGSLYEASSKPAHQ